MPLRAVQSRSLPDKVFEQLVSEIVSGGYAPDDSLPSERALTEILGVNRHVVREAIKRLEQIGLVKVVQGGPTKVLDFRQTAGLDLLAVVAEHADAIEPLPALFAATLEMRAGIGIDLSRLCAQRASRDVRADLQQLAEQLSHASAGPELLALDERFWQRILDGAGNLAYQLAFNSLIRAVHAIPDVSVPWLEQELRRSGYRRPLAAAIAAADEHAAAEAARTALAPAPEAIALLSGATHGHAPNIAAGLSL
jgi:GntR family transcriptional regulator, transcriptional repressor for pyruvate dehydrogenase complex